MAVLYRSGTGGRTISLDCDPDTGAVLSWAVEAAAPGIMSIRITNGAGTTEVSQSVSAGQTTGMFSGAPVYLIDSGDGWKVEASFG